MSTNKIFLTGFPGFISSRLIPKLLVDRNQTKLIALVQEKFLKLAEKSRENIYKIYPTLNGKIDFVSGDLVEPNLGIVENNFQFDEITEVFNLAAVYDLRVERDLAYRVNVKGTGNLIEFISKCKNLKKFHHVSTCYVAGWSKGIFSEDDFDKGQSFKNFYEETKFLSEKIIRENLDKIPTTIYRPSIVIGDSKTGETNKFDGPYPVIFTLNKLPKFTLMTQIGSGDTTSNLVPVDFVVDAIAKLSTLERKSITYHISDPHPKTQIQLLHLFSKCMNKKILLLKVNSAFIKFCVKLKPVAKFTELYPQMIDYFDHDITFDSSNALKDLESFKLICPPIETYIENIINFALAHKKSISKRGLW